MTSIQSSNGVAVDYDHRTGRFLIRLPYALNGLVRGMPNRRWNGKERAWTAPAIRTNIEYIERVFGTTPGTTYTDAARERLRAGVQRVTAAPRQFPTHYAFRLSPWQCQRTALDKVYGMTAAALFMDMRTGKSRVVVDEVSALRMEGRLERVLILPPLSVRRSWQREFAKIATVPYDLLLLNTKDGGKEFDAWNAKPHDLKVMVVGIESLSAGRAEQFCARFLNTSTRSMCVVDESHNIKNHAATRSERAVGLGRMAEFRRILTGTPLAKNPMDLYMQFEFLDPNIIGLGDFYSFRNRYAIMGGYDDREIIGYDNLPELFELLAPFVYQVRQSEVPELALLPKIQVLREVELTKRQRELYKRIEDEGQLMEREGAISVQNVLERMLRQQEIVGGFVSYENPNGPDKFRRERIEGANPKLDELLNVTEEYVGPTLIWCAYRPEIELVATALRERYGANQVVEIHGGVDEQERDARVQAFQSGRVQYVVGNAATGGVGLTMSRAQVNVYYSNTFNFIHRVQSSERSTGIAKKHPVTEIDIVAIDSVDETLIEAREQKLDVSEFVRRGLSRRTGGVDSNPSAVVR